MQWCNSSDLRSHTIVISNLQCRDLSGEQTEWSSKCLVPHKIKQSKSSRSFKHTSQVPFFLPCYTAGIEATSTTMVNKKGRTASQWSDCGGPVGSQTAGIHSPPDCRMTCSADVRRVLKDKILILLATEKITEGGIKIRQQNRLEVSLICNLKTTCRKWPYRGRGVVESYHIIW